MDNINKTIEQDKEYIDNILNTIAEQDEYDDKKTTEYLKAKEKVRDDLIRIEEIKVEREKIENDNMRSFITNAITITTFVIGTGVTLYGISQTFKFDSENTVTSTLGRGILNGIIKK